MDDTAEEVSGDENKRHEYDVHLLERPEECVNFDDGDNDDKRVKEKLNEGRLRHGDDESV